MKLKALVIAASIAAISYNAHASRPTLEVTNFDGKNIDWQLIGATTGTTGLVNGKTKAGKYLVSRVSLELNTRGELNVYRIFTTSDDVCTGPTQMSDHTPVMQYVNGQPVNMSYRCSAIGIMESTPTTVEGQHFVVNEFAQKNSVNWHGYAYSAKNFLAVEDSVLTTLTNTL